MSKWFWIAPVVIFGWLIYLAGSIVYDSGVRAGREETREEYKRECSCGRTQACAFGPGIVGIQQCHPYDLKWERCEPDPRYRVESKP